MNQSRPPTITSVITSKNDPNAAAPCPACSADRDRVVLSGVEGYFIAAVCAACGKGDRESRFYRGRERAEAALDSGSFSRFEA